MRVKGKNEQTEEISTGLLCRLRAEVSGPTACQAPRLSGLGIQLPLTAKMIHEYAFPLDVTCTLWNRNAILGVRSDIIRLINLEGD